ncbi:hypothetical protein Y032_0391g566 [Ancylostoma ceylanicum]|uniref:Uncharacterized protein n=1 Tax=Ancylostoma ceylanicum TaxID=53326 RepID=A0A016RS53_9BILA|nr:hypothetical protein Y032_0391g566 [Ancylostoma ceylanicum]
MHFQTRIFFICVPNRQSDIHRTPRLALLARLKRNFRRNRQFVSVSGSSRCVGSGKSGNFEGGGDDDSALSASGMSMCSNLHKVFVKMREEDGCTGAVAFVDVICNDYDQCIVSENKSHDECQPKICQKFKEMPKKDCFKELFFCD